MTYDQAKASLIVVNSSKDGNFEGSATHSERSSSESENGYVPLDQVAFQGKRGDWNLAKLKEEDVPDNISVDSHSMHSIDSASN